MIIPPFLNPGDQIKIVAPGARLQADELGIAVKMIQSWSLQVSVGNNVLSRTHNYLAGSDEERLSDLQHALDNPDVRAILCARGGYGTTRIIDSLDFTTFCKKPKWLVGFSDVTALHLALSHIGVESIHGAMPIQFGKADAQDSVSSLRDLLFGKNIQVIRSSNSANITGNVLAPMIGGNLSLIVDSLGTKYEPDTDGKILFLEEIDEYRYKVDRMMTQLKRAGKLSKLAGLVVGYMTDIRETDIPFDEKLEEIVLDKIPEDRFPVAFDLPIGHDHPNIAWRHGALVRLMVTRGKVSLTSPGDV